MVEVGISSEGAAGTLHETVSHLVCTISPHEIAQKAGGGADCTFDTLGRLPRNEIDSRGTVAWHFVGYSGLLARTDLAPSGPIR
jgi:hypothetical protein